MKMRMARKGPRKVVGNKGTPEGFELYHIDNDPGEDHQPRSRTPGKGKEPGWPSIEKWFDDVTAEFGN